MFIEVEIGFMVRYTIENNKYEGNRINYSSCESPKLTSTTLNTNVITWDKLVTKTRHTTSRDTIPGTTSTTRVDTTQTYKCEIYTLTATTNVNKGEYMTFYVARKTASYTPPDYNAEDGYKNIRYTDSYTAIISDPVPNGKVSITVQNGYKNQSTGSSSSSSSWTYMDTIWLKTASIIQVTYYPYVKYVEGWIRGVTETSSSTSTSSSWKETEPVHNIGTSSISIPLAAAQGNAGSIAFTTLGGLPRINVLLGNSIINSAYVSFNNYNVESSLFYLGTLNVNVTTKITGEKEV